MNFAKQRLYFFFEENQFLEPTHKKRKQSLKKKKCNN